MVNKTNNNNNTNNKNNSKSFQNMKNSKSVKDKQSERKNVKFGKQARTTLSNNNLTTPVMKNENPNENRLVTLQNSIRDHLNNTHSRNEHIRKIHHKHQHHEKFKEDLHKAIAHYESSKDEYASTLLYPEIYMARIPFLCPVPTALARATNIFSFNAIANKEFLISCVPEALCGPTTSQHLPFYYTDVVGTNNDDPNNPMHLANSLTREELFPGFQFDAVSQMRVVAFSATISQTNRLVDKAGYGILSRVYGLPITWASTVSKSAIINSVYKDEANFANGEDLRMVYAPADFSDLHMKAQSDPQVENDLGTLPVLQAFLTGFNGLAGTAVVTFTIEFNVVIEYVPLPIMQQMVERKPAQISPSKVAKAENAVGKQTDFKLENPGLLSEFHNASPGELFDWANSLPGRQQKNSALNLIRSMSRNILPDFTTLGTAFTSLLSNHFNPLIRAENNKFLATNLTFKASKWDFSDGEPKYKGNNDNEGNDNTIDQKSKQKNIRNGEVRR